MACSRSIPVGILAALISFALSLWAREPEPSPWLEIHSTHFTVVTDAGEKKGKEVAFRFEQMRAVFASLLMRDRLNEPVPLTILAFKNDKTFYQSAPLANGQPISVPGFLVPGDDQSYIALNLFEEESWRDVAHDFAHRLMNYNYPPVEGWFDEGMAEYFSSIRFDNRQVEIGGDPELSPAYTQDLLQNQHEAQSLPKSLTELLSGQVWLALPDLLTMKHDTANYNEATHHTLFYAQSWITVHYLINKKMLPQTGTYFNLVENQHVPVEEAIQKAYEVTPAQFDQAVKDYFHSLTPLFSALDASKVPNAPRNPSQPYQFSSPIGPEDSAITAKPMSEVNARALIDDMKVRIPNRREVALQDLKVLATTPEPTQIKPDDKKSKKSNDEGAPLVATVGNEIAHRSLAWDHLQHGEFDATAEELSDAAALNQGDMWIRYYLSVLKYRSAKAKHADIQGLPNMMQDLKAVLDWHPEFADAYDLLAVARMVGGGSIAAMQAERAAMQLSPRNQEYVYHLAEIYVEAKKWDAARALLDRLKTSTNTEVAAEAKDQLNKLASEQKYGLTASLATGGQKLTPQSSPFDILDQDAAKRAAEEKAEQTAAVDKRPPKFVEGRLVGVDCSQSPAAVLTVVSGGTILKLRTSDYKSLLLIGAETFSCAWNDRSVAVNYKPGGLSDGDLVSVEVH
jgi:hypothetical protein